MKKGEEELEPYAYSLFFFHLFFSCFFVFYSSNPNRPLGYNYFRTLFFSTVNCEASHETDRVTINRFCASDSCVASVHENALPFVFLSRVESEGVVSEQTPSSDEFLVRSFCVARASDSRHGRARYKQPPVSRIFRFDYERVALTRTVLITHDPTRTGRIGSPRLVAFSP